MKRLLLGTLLAALAMFVWGMIYWGANPLPYTTWKHVPDEAAAGRALLDNFPENGTYYVPNLTHDKDTLARLMAQGPVAFVHMLRREGRPLLDPSIMVKGFILYLVVGWVLGALLATAAPALPSYGGRVKLAVLAALLAVLMIDIGDSVWWYVSIAWKLQLAIYDFTALVIGGLVLARFTGPARGAARAAA